MPKTIPLKHLTEKERGILVEGIPLLRNTDPYYFEEPQFKKLYGQWMAETKGHYHDEQPFEQFKLMISQMKRTMPNTYQKPAKKNTWWDEGIVRKLIDTSDYTKG